MFSLIYSDAIDNPIDGALLPDNPPPYKEAFSLEQINAAKKLIEEELPTVKAKLSLSGKFETARRLVRLNFAKKEAILEELPLD